MVPTAIAVDTGHWGLCLEGMWPSGAEWLDYHAREAGKQRSVTSLYFSVSFLVFFFLFFVSHLGIIVLLHRFAVAVSRHRN